MSVTIIGYFLLLHAAYSSHEHHHVLRLTGSLPMDIILELVAGLMVVNFGTLASLRRPKSLTLDTGVPLENKHINLKPIEISKAMNAFNNFGVTPFEHLETRVEMMDVVAKRAEYAAWANAQ